MRPGEVVKLVGALAAIGCGSESPAGQHLEQGTQTASSGGLASGGSNTGHASTTGDVAWNGSDATSADVDTASSAGGASATGADAGSALVVPGGVFAMGRSQSGSDACPADQECHPSEQPEHDVAVATFRLDATEVSVALFRNWVDTYGSSPPVIASGTGRVVSLPGSGWQAEYAQSLPPDRASLLASLACDADATYSEESGASDSLPVNCVTWYEALAFCIARGGRLPSEAEWEFAAAGGDENRLYPWGDEPVSDARAAVEVNALVPTGSLSAGEGRYGHFDLAGNVWEWTLDWLDPEAYARAAECPGCLPSSEGSHRSLRGGAFSYPAVAARAAVRSGDLPGERSRAVGFRCAFDE